MTALLPEHLLMQKLIQLDERLTNLNNEDLAPDQTLNEIQSIQSTISALISSEPEHISSEDMTFEFFNMVCEVTENISALRLSEEPLRQILIDQKTFPFFNKLIRYLKDLVFLHPSLRDSKPLEFPEPKNTTEALEQAEKTAHFAAQASDIAEKANAEGLQRYDLLKRQKETMGEINSELIQNTNLLNLEAYAKNAAAVIAADAAAAAIAKLEDLTNAEKNNRSGE